MMQQDTWEGGGGASDITAFLAIRYDRFEAEVAAQSNNDAG
jgi:hypothetical protein